MASALRTIIPMLLAWSLLMGCSESPMHGDDASTTEAELAFCLEDTDSRGDTDLSELEEKLEHAYLLFFPMDSEPTDCPIAWIRAEATAEGLLSFRIPRGLQEGLPYRLVAVGNADCFTPDGYDSYQDYLGAPISTGKAFAPQLYHKDAMTADVLTCLPMKGESTFSWTRSDGKCRAEGRLEFRKLVARIDIESLAGDDFMIEGGALCNWRDRVNVMNPDVPAGEVRGILSSEADGGSDETPLRFAAATDAKGQAIRHSLYCFPSYSETSMPTDRQTPAVILRARYGDAPSPTFYRFNAGTRGNSDGSAKVEANGKYRMVIKSVAGPGASTPEEAYEGVSAPIIPDEDVAFMPLCDSNVKVDYKNRTIEIDAFDPDCFNGFIDVPFKVHIASKFGADASVTLKKDSKSPVWPLEGRISKNPTENFKYCPCSFATSDLGIDPTVFDGKNEVSAKSTEGAEFSVKAGDTFYISVGAMGPDDPEIVRTLTVDLSGLGMTPSLLTFTIIVKPRPTIINDVVLTAPGGQDYWMIMDRNIQNVSTQSTYIGRDSSGNRKQAYNYSYLTTKTGPYVKTPTMFIPFKQAADGTSISESSRLEDRGLGALTKTLSTIKTTFSNGRINWLKENEFASGMPVRSPFYDATTLDGWIFPTSDVMALIAGRLRMSKMRFYLVSDFPAITEEGKKEVCCYLPFHHNDQELDRTTNYSYCVSNPADGSQPADLRLIYYSASRKAELHSPSMNTTKSAMGRLCRKLSKEELDYYLSGFLGYNGGRCMAETATPDTYPFNAAWSK